MWAEKIAPGSVATLEQEAPALVAAHTAVEAAEEHTVAAGIAGPAAVDIAAARTVAAVVEEAARTGAAAAGVLAEGVVAEGRTAEEAVEVAGPVEAKRAREEGHRSLRHIPGEAVATATLAAVPARRPPEQPVRRKMGSRSSKEEHRVRTADISS
jgi:hypothetical protein